MHSAAGDRMKIAGTVLLFAVATAVTFCLHEAAHWGMGEWLGYDMFLRTNSAGLARGAYASDVHQNLVTAAGPGFTLLQGFVAYLFVRAFEARVAFAFLLSALLMRMLAAGVSLATPNDEMRLSLAYNLGPWTVFAAVIGVLFVLTVLGAWRLRLGWREIGVSVGCWLVFASAIILSERYLPAYIPAASS